MTLPFLARCGAAEEPTREADEPPTRDMESSGEITIDSSCTEPGRDEVVHVGSTTPDERRAAKMGRKESPSCAERSSILGSMAALGPTVVKDPSSDTVVDASSSSSVSYLGKSWDDMVDGSPGEEEVACLAMVALALVAACEEFMTLGHRSHRRTSAAASPSQKTKDQEIRRRSYAKLIHVLRSSHRIAILNNRGASQHLRTQTRAGFHICLRKAQRIRGYGDRGTYGTNEHR